MNATRETNTTPASPLTEDAVVVRFKRQFRTWGENEVAGFRPDFAAQLIKNGIAVKVDKASPRPPADKQQIPPVKK